MGIEKKQEGEELSRIQWDERRNTVSVSLNSKIYKIDRVLKVAQSFAGACLVDVGGDAEGVIQVKLKPKSKKIKAREVGYEFCNHVLAEMKMPEDI